MEKLPIKEIHLHGVNEGKTVLVDGDYDGEYFSQFNWRTLPSGYVYRSEVKDGISKIIYLHQEVARPPKGVWVRHIDGDKLNNRSCNLEWITPKESAMIRKKRSVREKEISTQKQAAYV